MSGSPAGLDLTVQVCRFRLAPRSALRFGQSGAANDFRGALGFHLPETVFRPRNEAGPSGLRDAPRPFVVRARQLDGRVLAPAEEFTFRLHLFDQKALDLVARAVRAVCASGLGPDRVPLQYVGFTHETLNLDLRPREAAPNCIEVGFLTPVELKGWDERPPVPFGVLMSRLRDRISALRAAYGSGPADFDFQGLAQRAQAVECQSWRMEHTAAVRKSLRTGQVHPLGGFTGACVYRGELGEFVPLLEAGAFTGVGRQTVWGKGEIAVRAAEPAEEPR